MKTEDLIADLAGRVTPVRPLRRPAIRAVAWFVLATAFAVAGVTLLGARHDVMLRLTQSDYLWTASLALTASMLAVVVSLVLAIPGAERTSALRLSTIGVLGLWAVTMVWAVVETGRGLPIATDPHWRVCFARVMVVSVVPLLVLFSMIRRGAALRPAWAGTFAAVAAASIGALVAQIVCPLDDAGHAFLGHFVPVIVIAALGAAAQRILARQITA